MTQSDSHPLWQRLAALFLLGSALTAICALFGLPLADAVAGRDAALARLSRLERALKVPVDVELHYDPKELTAEHPDDGAAQLSLQSAIDRIARTAGLVVQSARPLEPESLGAVGRAVWIDISLTGDLQALTEFLAATDAERPILLIRKLDASRGSGARGDAAMPVRAEIGLAWRPVQEGSAAK